MNSRSRFTKTNKPSPKNDFQHDSDITAALNPIFKVLRVLGCCPISINIKKGGAGATRKCEYSLKLLSFPVLYTTAALLFYVVLSYYIFVHQILNEKITRFNPNDVNSFSGRWMPTQIHWAATSFVFVYHLWLFLNPFLLILGSPFIIKFIGNVTIFSHQFGKNFRGQIANFSHSKSSIRFVFRTHAVILCILSLIISITCFPCLTNLWSSRTICSNFSVIDSWVAYLGILLGGVTSYTLDTMLISFLCIIENMLLEFKKGMKSCYLANGVNAYNIGEWAKLGRTLRLQANIFNRIVGPAELSSLLMIFLTWVLFAFMVIRAKSYANVALGSIAFFCLSNIVRLHIKTLYVARITTVENKIRYLFIKMKAGAESSYLDCERSLFTSVMAIKRIQFTFCNMIELNPGLTLWLIGGVVTYLMVLLQFQDLIGLTHSDSTTK